MSIPVLETWPWMRGQERCIEVIALYPPEKVRIKRLVLLNAVVPPRKPMLITVAPVSIEDVKRILAVAKTAVPIESYIGHESTAQLLSQLLSVNIPVNRAEYSPEVGDLAVVVRLKRRLPAPQDVKNITVEDLEFYVVNYELDVVEVWK